MVHFSEISSLPAQQVFHVNPPLGSTISKGVNSFFLHVMLSNNKLNINLIVCISFDSANIAIYLKSSTSSYAAFLYSFTENAPFLDLQGHELYLFSKE